MEDRKTYKGVIFFEKTPFMSVELLDIVDNFQVLSYFQDYISEILPNKTKVLTYGNTETSIGINSDKAIEKILSDKVFIRNTFSSTSTFQALFFYMNQAMDSLCKANEIQMALPEYEIQEKLGSKLNLKDICKELNIKVNKTLSFNSVNDKESTFSECVKEVGLPFILQGSLGVSGEDTFLISNLNEFLTALEKVNNIFKVSRYLKNNIPISVHVCILDNEIIIQGPFIQLLGFTELTSNPYQFSGNDTNQSLFNKELISRVLDLTKQFANHIKEKNYRGILGIDYLWEIESNELYPQEFNTRLVGLTRLLTGIQRDQGLIPDLYKHISYFSKSSKLTESSNLIDGKLSLPNNYSQIYISNNLTENKLIKTYLEPGIYNTNNNMLTKVSNSLLLCDLKNEEILITFSAYKNSLIHPGSVIIKMISKKSAMIENEYKLSPWVNNVAKFIKNYIYE